MNTDDLLEQCVELIETHLKLIGYEFKDTNLVSTLEKRVTFCSNLEQIIFFTKKQSVKNLCKKSSKKLVKKFCK